MASGGEESPDAGSVPQKFATSTNKTSQQKNKQQKSFTSSTQIQINPEDRHGQGEESHANNSLELEEINPEDRHGQGEENQVNNPLELQETSSGSSCTEKVKKAVRDCCTVYQGRTVQINPDQLGQGDHICWDTGFSCDHAIVKSTMRDSTTQVVSGVVWSVDDKAKIQEKRIENFDAEEGTLEKINYFKTRDCVDVCNFIEDCKKNNHIFFFNNIKLSKYIIAPSEQFAYECKMGMPLHYQISKCTGPTALEMLLTFIVKKIGISPFIAFLFDLILQENYFDNPFIRICNKVDMIPIVAYFASDLLVVFFWSFLVYGICLTCCEKSKMKKKKYISDDASLGCCDRYTCLCRNLGKAWYRQEICGGWLDCGRAIDCHAVVKTLLNSCFQWLRVVLVYSCLACIPDEINDHLLDVIEFICNVILGILVSFVLNFVHRIPACVKKCQVLYIER